MKVNDKFVYINNRLIFNKKTTCYYYDWCVTFVQRIKEEETYGTKGKTNTTDIVEFLLCPQARE